MCARSVGVVFLKVLIQWMDKNYERLHILICVCVSLELSEETMTESKSLNRFFFFWCFLV